MFLRNRLTNIENRPVVAKREGLREEWTGAWLTDFSFHTENGHANGEEYFSSTPLGVSRAKEIVRKNDPKSLISHMETLGLLLLADERGRVYPAGRQASSITDALRFYAEIRGVQTRTNTRVIAIEKDKTGFVLTAQTGENTQRVLAENVVFCTGGKAAKNFGSDGAAYALAQKFGHTLTALYPSLVQLKTDTATIKTLKGIRAMDVGVTARWQGGSLALQGDVIFTDYGVSGDAIFRISAFVSDKKNTKIEIDFLPDFSEEKIYQTLLQKQKRFPKTPVGELLCGVVNNQIGRAVMKFCEGDLRKAAKIVKAFPLSVTGTLGFDYAQVTKGGIPVEETDENLQSRFVKNLYFAGEILDVDGQCGGYNLQWAYASASVVAKAISAKTRGHV